MRLVVSSPLIRDSSLPRTSQSGTGEPYPLAHDLQKDLRIGVNETISQFTLLAERRNYLEQIAVFFDPSPLAMMFLLAHRL